MISKDMTLSNANVKNSFSLTPIVQLVDEVPSYLLPAAGEDNVSGNNQGEPQPRPGEITFLIKLIIFSLSRGLDLEQISRTAVW